MRLWIDDVRNPPDDTWNFWAKTSEEAIQIITRHPRIITEISFDHDLGGEDTSVPVADMLELMAFNKELSPITWYIHSANPVGRNRLKLALDRADHWWYNSGD